MAKKKPLDQELFEEPYRFSFFQAVRLMGLLEKERKPVGRDAMPAEELVRFRSRVSLDFPASEIQEIRVEEGEEGAEAITEMIVNFIGLVGVSGALPTHYTEHAINRIRYGDTAFWAFTDIFTHRATSLFYRAWQKYRFPYAYEAGDDEFTQYLFDLTGLGTKGLRGRMSLEDESLLPYSGLITQKPHSATNLAQIVSDYFAIRVRIMQFFGQWIDLDKESITRLSIANSNLGVDAIIGTRVWDQQSKFRLVLGALSFLKFQAFLPKGNAHEALRSIVRFMVGLESDFDVQLILEASQVPSTILTTRAKRRPMLGWTSWLKSVPFEADDDQLVIRF
jgi:type VI secretion system protein ImpH